MLRSLAIDYERRGVGVQHVDGRIASTPLEDAAIPDFVAHASYDAQTDEVTVSFQDGERLTQEVGARKSLDDRPVVYLDQNYWISLARLRYAPQRVRSEERAACEAISALAEAGKIVLPLSGGHAVETARNDGRRRHDLGMTMLRLSRGWQMLSPLKVRELELGNDIAGNATTRDDRPSVFTLEPDSLFAVMAMPTSAVPPAPSTSPVWLLRHLHWVALFAEMLLEDEISDEGRGPELAAGWAQGHSELSQYMRMHRTPREHKRINAHICMLLDLKADLEQVASGAGLVQTELECWLEGLRTGMAKMPYIGRVGELIYHRLCDASAAWEPNDLNDVQFLCCAAGYADVVVCEKETADHLDRAARNAPPGAVVCKSLAAGWDALQELLDE